MITVLRRLFWLGVLGGAGYGGWTIWRRRTAPAPVSAPAWPPMPPAPTGDPVTDPVPSGTRETTDSTWREPVDGACPDGWPVKVNTKSGIFHVPGGRFYERTVPDRCYPEAAAAEADGYRASRS